MARISRRINGNDVPMGSRHVGSRKEKSELCWPEWPRSQKSRMHMCASIYECGFQKQRQPKVPNIKDAVLDMLGLQRSSCFIR